MKFPNDSPSSSKSSSSPSCIHVRVPKEHQESYNKIRESLTQRGMIFSDWVRHQLFEAPISYPHSVQPPRSTYAVAIVLNQLLALLHRTGNNPVFPEAERSNLERLVKEAMQLQLSLAEQTYHDDRED